MPLRARFHLPRRPSLLIKVPGGERAIDAKSHSSEEQHRHCRNGTPNLKRRNFTLRGQARSEEHTSELQSLMRNSYAVFCMQKKINTNTKKTPNTKYTVKKTKT